MSKKEKKKRPVALLGLKGMEEESSKLEDVDIDALIEKKILTVESQLDQNGYIKTFDAVKDLKELWLGTILEESKIWPFRYYWYVSKY